jgi:formylglycine-generating enzyme required for sulfatase activity
MAKHEVTLAQWETVEGDRLRYRPGESGSTLEQWRRAGRSPVTEVSFSLARDFTRRIGLQLPTEAQWEYACRAGTDTIWWTGAEPESLLGQKVNIGDDVARASGLLGFDDGYERWSPVDSMAVNAFGLHHMLGNVWEMTRDGNDVEGGVFLPGDGSHTVVLTEDLVIRGGGFHSGPAKATSAVRALLAAESIAKTIGFRPARKLLGQWGRD